MTIGQSTGGGSLWTEEYYNWEIKSNSGSDMDSENGSNVEVGDGEDPDAEGKMEVPTGCIYHSPGDPCGVPMESTSSPWSPCGVHL